MNEHPLVQALRETRDQMYADQEHQAEESVTVSRDCAGHAWLALMQVGADLLPPAKRKEAKEELFAALWPQTVGSSGSKNGEESS